MKSSTIRRLPSVDDVDLVLDTMGGETQKRSWQVLKKGGSLVSILSQPSQKEADAWGVRGAFFVVRPNAAELTQIADLVDSGKVQPVVENILPLSDARKAQELSQHAERSCSKSRSAKLPVCWNYSPQPLPIAATLNQIPQSTTGAAPARFLFLKAQAAFLGLNPSKEPDHVIAASRQEPRDPLRQGGNGVCGD
jgi:Zinc-binding dehydrogenase